VTTTALPIRVQPQPVTLRRVIRSEWLKFWTLRSTLAVLAGAFVGMIGISLIVAYNTRTLSAGQDPEDLVPSATLQGYYLGQLLIGALGVLFVSGEYSTGMIRSTLAATPKRLPVLWAKLVVFTAITLVTMVTASVLAFLASQALLAQYRPGFSLSDPHVLRVVLGTGLYLTLVGLVGASLGWIVRSTPGALVAYVATVLVIPVLFRTVLGSWGKHVAQYLPTQAGADFSTSLSRPPSLSPYTGLTVMIGWVVVGFVVSGVLLLRRDA
jgi:ABC-2 type transport system permease protein